MSFNIYSIKILGVTLTVQTAEDIEYLKQTERLLADTIIDVQESLGLRDSLSVAIMAGFFLSDRIKRDEVDSSRELNQRVQKLLSELDGILMRLENK